MLIKELCELAHKTAVEKGFWEEEEEVVEIGNEKVVSLKRIVPRNKSELLMLIVTELGEACEALRMDNRQSNDAWRKDTFEDEIADVFIRLADMCEALGIDIEWQIEKKLDYNKTRIYKHGKKF